MSEPTIQQKLTAEVIGTFVLVFFGCGSVVVYGTAQAANDGRLLPSTVTTVGLTFGVAVMVMVYAFGRVSGGHFNPAVSVGAGVGGRMAWREVGFYILAQLVGAVLGALLLFLLLQGFDNFDAEGNMGQNAFGDVGSGYAGWAAFLLELVLTAVFVTVILAVTDERNEHPALAPLAIGFTLAAIHFVAIPATGTSVNPARSIGPALFAGADAIEQLWLFILAPLIGAAVAGLAYPLLFGRVGEVVAGSGLRFGRPRTAAQAPGYAAPDQYQQQWNQEPAVAEPIVQDGWQWDPVGQQWHPVGSTPEQWRAQQEAEQAAAAEEASAAERAPESSEWPEGDPGDGGTQIRPPHA
ncbi:MIP family channel protein [Nocardioides sp. YIM 152315]|uniref:MIP/aquaporin family protein n=1 Tax=Nocardioides sp. YIM 152315 TaxID=3031760 RepID=UPI0023DC3AF1|nr:MIP family channel protein [Nocardioides sp. YIM 152315]MDF1602326.1 MIP family channel protein [Nocardioides sp. YIM 152315]